MRVLIIVGLVLAAGFVSRVQSQESVERLEISGVDVDGDSILLAAGVLDSSGSPVAGLTSTDFSAELDGSDVEVASVEPGVDPSLGLALIIVIDTSGSMAGGPLEAAQAAATPLIQSLRPVDRAALLSFSDTVTTVVPFTNDVVVLQSGLDSLVAQGNTALFGAVAESAGIALAAQEPRRAIVLLSDGEDFGGVSGVDRQGSLDAVAFARIPFLVLGLGDGADLQYLAAVAGSPTNLLTAQSASELAQLYQQVTERLLLQYSVRLNLPAGLESGVHDLQLRVGDAVETVAVSLEGTVPLASPRLEGIPERLDGPAPVTVLDAPQGATIRVTVDGVAQDVEGDGFVLDPYEFAPGQRELRVDFSPPGVASPIVAAIFVPALAPSLLEPDENVALQPGEVVRLRVRAQPGPLRATFVLDGDTFVEVAEGPYEFAVGSDLAAGDHHLEIRLASGDVESSTTFAFSVAGEGGPPLLAYLVVGLFALAAGAAGVYAVTLAISRTRSRTGRGDRGALAGVLMNWRSKQTTSERSLALPASSGQSAGQPGPVWGVLTVREGPAFPMRFELSADVELVGRGKSCSVRLNDRKVDEHHCVISRERQVVPSTRAALVEVNGQAVRGAKLANGARIKLGATVLEFESLVPTSSGTASMALS